MAVQSSAAGPKFTVRATSPRAASSVHSEGSAQSEEEYTVAGYDNHTLTETDKAAKLRADGDTKKERSPAAVQHEGAVQCPLSSTVSKADCQKRKTLSKETVNDRVKVRSSEGA